MIHVERVPEPEDFDARVRRPGRAWLAANPAPKRPRDLWSPFRAVLARGFGHRCGYTVMYDPVGSVDHHLSVKARRDLTYEWHNYRFCQEWLNKSKRNEDQAVLDPHEVGEGWFEIELPSLMLRATDKIPADLRARAEHTLDRLHLRDDERVLRQRREWYRMYQEGELSPPSAEERARAERRAHLLTFLADPPAEVLAAAEALGRAREHYGEDTDGALADLDAGRHLLQRRATKTRAR